MSDDFIDKEEQNEENIPTPENGHLDYKPCLLYTSGIHSRTNFDLSQHEKFSGKSIKYFDPELNESYTPCLLYTSHSIPKN